MRAKSSWRHDGRLWILIPAAVACFSIAMLGCASNSKSVVTPRDPKGEGSKIIDESLDIGAAALFGTPDAVAPEEPKPRLTAKGEPVPAFEDIDELPYLIEAGDQIEFRCFDDPALSQVAQVRYDGHISLPMIPDIKVQLLTRDEATELVTEAYSEVFREPQLSLAVITASSKTYHVMGDVMNPQEFPYIKPISVLDAINQAGGPRINQRSGDSFVGSRSTLTQALIIRRYGGGRDVIECDLSKYREPEHNPADTLVLPNDIVYIPEGVNLVYVLGEARAPDVYQLMEGTTLLQLLTRARGFSEPTARMRQVVLIREIEEDMNRVFLINVREMLKTGQDMVMKPGDILYIPQKPLVRLQQFVSRFVGSISPLMSLYREAYDTYYTDRRYDELFRRGYSTGTSDLLRTLESIRSFGSLATSIPVP